MNALRPSSLSIVSMIVLLLAASPMHLLAQTAIPFGTPDIKTFTLSNKAGSNEIKFQLDAPIETIKGTASDIQGSLTINMRNIEAMRGTITVGVKSMSTGLGLRDNHMLNPEWLDAAQYPTITFAIEKCIDLLTKQTDAANGRAVIEGKAVGSFTLHGVTKPLTASFSMTYSKSASQATETVSIRTQFSIPWKEYGVKGKKGLANMTVGEVVVINAILSGQ